MILKIQIPVSLLLYSRNGTLYVLVDDSNPVVYMATYDVEAVSQIDQAPAANQVDVVVNTASGNINLR